MPWGATLAFVVVPFFLLDLSNGKMLGAIDTQPVIPTAVSLVCRGDVNLDEFGPGFRRDLLHDKRGRLKGNYQRIRGHVYSAYPAGMVPVATLMVGAARLCGAQLERPDVFIRLEKLTAALVASATLGLFFMTATRLAPAPAALAVTWLLATGSAIYTSVGLGLWQHGGVTTLLLLALLVECATEGRPGARGLLLQGVALGQMLACRPTAAVLTGLFGLWVLVRDPRRALALGLIAALSYAPWIAVYHYIYGNIFGPRTINSHMSHGLWSLPGLLPLSGVLISPGRGLFVYQPWAVLALAALFPSLHAAAIRRGMRPGPRGWMAFSCAASLTHILLIASWRVWGGGWCWGSRLLTDIVPLLGLLSLPGVTLLIATRPGRRALLGLAILGIATHAPCIYRQADLWNHTSDHALDYWSWTDAPFLFRP